jgi:hypothetical protein
MKQADRRGDTLKDPCLFDLCEVLIANTRATPDPDGPQMAHLARSAYARFLAFSARTGLIGKVSEGSI